MRQTDWKIDRQTVGQTDSLFARQTDGRVKSNFILTSHGPAFCNHYVKGADDRNLEETSATFCSHTIWLLTWHLMSRAIDSLQRRSFSVGLNSKVAGSAAGNRRTNEEKWKVFSSFGAKRMSSSLG